MASFFDELATYLDTQQASLIFTADSGRNVFLNELPADPEACVAFFGQAGTTLGAQRDIPGLQFPRFQVVSRSEDYEEAATLMAAVRDTLHGIIGLSLTSYRLMRCHAEQEATPLGQDAQGRHEFACNFIAEYHAT